MKKLALALTLFGVLTTSIGVTTLASTVSTPTLEIEARGEITGYKYMTIDGVKYKRLWSYTYDRWVDSSWIKV